MEMIRSSYIQLVFGEMSLCVKKCGIQISTKWLLAINYNGKGKAIVFSTRNETSLDLFMKKICKCMKRYYSSFIVSNGNSCALSLSLSDNSWRFLHTWTNHFVRIQSYLMPINRTKTYSCFIAYISWMMGNSALIRVRIYGQYTKQNLMSWTNNVLVWRSEKLCDFWLWWAWTWNRIE